VHVAVDVISEDRRNCKRVNKDPFQALSSYYFGNQESKDDVSDESTRPSAKKPRREASLNAASCI